MPGRKLAATLDYSFHCRIMISIDKIIAIALKATLKTSIIILVIDNHNKNPAMLAIKYLNNIIRFEKPVPVILNRTACLGYLRSKGDTPIFRSKKLPNVYDCHIWRLIIQSQAGLIETTYMLQI